jgi:hypothetical protein
MAGMHDADCAKANLAENYAHPSDCDSCAVDEPETKPVPKIEPEELAPAAPTCPTCSQAVTIRGKYIGVHFAKPEDYKPCPNSFKLA